MKKSVNQLPEPVYGKDFESRVQHHPCCFSRAPETELVLLLEGPTGSPAGETTRAPSRERQVGAS